MKTLPLNYFAFLTVKGSWQLLKSSESGDVMYSTSVVAKCKNVSEAIFMFKSYLPEYEERSKK
ncbi:MAG: hypothetical protein PHP99_04225 [Paludibacter sp.]|nr:hypothetical protein [Paludibacter sp.]